MLPVQEKSASYEAASPHETLPNVVGFVEKSSNETSTVTESPGPTVLSDTERLHVGVAGPETHSQSRLHV